MRARRISKQIDVGGVKVGGDAPVGRAVHDEDRYAGRRGDGAPGPRDGGGGLRDRAMCSAGHGTRALALAEIKRQSNIPIVADIHFHYQLALESLKSGVDCLRLNPGNIRDRGKVETVVREAKARQVPIRIGVNFGSLPPVGAIGVDARDASAQGTASTSCPRSARPSWGSTPSSTTWSRRACGRSEYLRTSTST